MCMFIQFKISVNVSTICCHNFMMPLIYSSIINNIIIIKEMIKLETSLRIRPLEAKYKLKQDYYAVYANGLPSELKGSQQFEPEKTIIALQGHPLAGAQANVSSLTALQKQKQQFFSFDKVFGQEATNDVIYNDGISSLIRDTLNSKNTSCLIVSFGHQQSGKSYNIIGQNNHTLHKSITDVPLSQAQDSRGSVLRCISDIKSRDPQAKVTFSYVDLTLDNIRDLMKHVKKERVKQQSIIAVNFSDRIFSQKGEVTEMMQGSNTFHRMTEEEKQFQKNIIEKEYVDLEEPTQYSFINNPTYKLGGLAEIEVKDDLSEVAYYLDKCLDMSDSLNERVGYTLAIRSIQLINVTVVSGGKKTTLLFVDLPDYDKIQSNVIDHQKIFEMVIINNAMSALSSILTGFAQGHYAPQNAPYEKSKLTKIIRAFTSSATKLNIAFLCSIWPTEARFNDVLHTLHYLDRFTKLDDPSNQYNDVEHAFQLEEKEQILQTISHENMDIKQKIDSFRRNHQAKLNALKEKLGINATFQQFEMIIKSKPGSREYQAAKEHKDFVEKTENMVKMNREIEEKILQIKQDATEQNYTKRQIQENFSQQYFIVYNKIERLREQLKVSETQLDQIQREQLKTKDEELQKVLNQTHSQLLENQGLVDHIITDTAAALSTLPEKSRTVMGNASRKTLPQHVNLVKEDSKRISEEKYEILLQKQTVEFEKQHEGMIEKYENIVKNKTDEIQKTAQIFKVTHEKYKRDQYMARSEIVGVYNIAKKQDQVLANVENGFYSRTTKRIRFNDDERPLLPTLSEFDFLHNSLQKASGQKVEHKKQSIIVEPSTIKKANESSVEQESVQQSRLTPDSIPTVIVDPVTKDPDSYVDAEALRKLVYELMGSMKDNHSTSHPAILNGESVEDIVKETNNYKKQCEQAERKINEIRVQGESQRRMIERIGLTTKSTL